MKKFTITATEAHGNVRYFNTTVDRKLQKRVQKNFERHPELFQMSY